MIPLSPEAEAQLDGLLVHYENSERLEAARNLLAAIQNASSRIQRSPDAGLSAPRPYPDLARYGFRWIKEGAYWVADTDNGLIIVGVFYHTADIPHRI